MVLERHAGLGHDGPSPPRCFVSVCCARKFVARNHVCAECSRGASAIRRVMLSGRRGPGPPDVHGERTIVVLKTTAHSRERVSHARLGGGRIAERAAQARDMSLGEMLVHGCRLLWILQGTGSQRTHYRWERTRHASGCVQADARSIPPLHAAITTIAQRGARFDKTLQSVRIVTSSRRNDWRGGRERPAMSRSSSRVAAPAEWSASRRGNVTAGRPGYSGDPGCYPAKCLK